MKFLGFLSFALFWLLFWLMTLAACASTRFGYFPVGKQETISAEQHGVSLPVKFSSTEGTIQVMSLGIVDLKSGTKPVHFPALHLRLIVSNTKGAAPWVMSARDQKVILSSGATSIPAYLKSDTKHPPQITISAGETHRLDLFYPLPKNQEEPKALNGFTLHWKITANNEMLEKKIRFVRQETHHKYETVEVNSPAQHQNMVLDEEEMTPGLWWYDSNYPSEAFPGATFYPPLY